MANSITFEEALTDDDWGIIVGKNGELKGLFIPQGADDQEVPDAIIKMCKEIFGVDPSQEVTYH